MDKITTICSSLATKNGNIALRAWLRQPTFADAYLFVAAGIFNLPMSIQIKGSASVPGRRSSLGNSEDSILNYGDLAVVGTQYT